MTRPYIHLHHLSAPLAVQEHLVVMDLAPVKLVLPVIFVAQQKQQSQKFALKISIAHLDQLNVSIVCTRTLVMLDLVRVLVSI